jgi:hypothetical protein
LQTRAGKRTPGHAHALHSLCFFDEGVVDAAHGVAVGDVLTPDGH